MLSSNFQKSIIKFMPKTVCNLIKTPFSAHHHFPVFVYQLVNHKNHCTKKICNQAIDMSRSQGVPGNIPMLGLAWQSFHHPWASGSTNSCPKLGRAGACSVLPLQAEAHKALVTNFKIQSSISLSLRRQRRQTRGEQKNIISSAINYSARDCPQSLFFSPVKVQGIRKEQCLATFS